jgi:short-subunit dehydrogenase
LITGATKGIGADIARAFAAAGADLVLSGRTEAELESTRTTLGEQFRSQICTAVVDLADPDGPQYWRARPSTHSTGSTSWSTTQGSPTRSR